MKKNTVFTVIAVLLMLATLCLPAAAQTWQLKTSWAGPDDDAGQYKNDIVDIEFRDNHQVFFGKWDRLYKWDFVTGHWHRVDYGGHGVRHVEVPRGDSSVVIHSVDGNVGETVAALYIRNADDMSVQADRILAGERVRRLDVDEGGFYLVVVDTELLSPGGIGVGGGVPAQIEWDVEVMDIWGTDGWQLEYESGGNYTSPHGDVLIHPTYGSEYSEPRWYHQEDPDDEHFVERTDFPRSDLYTTTRWEHIDRMAITVHYPGGTRLAALDSGNIIHVWDYSGDHLFTLNDSENHSAHDDILEFTYNGELLVTAYGHWVRFWDVSQQALDHSFWVEDLPGDESIESLAFSDNGKLMAIGGSDGVAYIYDWTGGSAPAAPAQKPEQQETALLANYPNPFNPETWIPYQLAEPAEVQVSIHSADGKLVRKLELGQVPAGVYQSRSRAVHWDGRNAQGEPVASGVYFYTLTAGEFSATRKMVIRK